MTDIFIKEDFNLLLKHKYVYFFGDSNVRALYKDFVCLSQKSTLINENILKKKLETSCLGDKLLKWGEKTNGRDYREEREFINRDFRFSFTYVTRIYSDYVEQQIIQKWTSSKKPDIVVLSSCLWDVTRWGPNGVDKYRKNIVQIMKRFNEVLGPDCLVIWLTTQPISQNIKGGFLIKQLEFMELLLRFHVMEANSYVRKVVVAHGYDVLDLHYHFRMQIQRRCPDGIHWIPEAVRYGTNLLLTHISLALGTPLPHRNDAPIVTSHTLQEIDDESASSIFKESSSTNADKVPQSNDDAKSQEANNNQSKKKKNRKNNKKKFQCMKYRTQEAQSRVWQHEYDNTMPAPYDFPALNSGFPPHQPSGISSYWPPMKKSAPKNEKHSSSHKSEHHKHILKDLNRSDDHGKKTMTYTTADSSLRRFVRFKSTPEKKSPRERWGRSFDENRSLRNDSHSNFIGFCSPVQIKKKYSRLAENRRERSSPKIKYTDSENRFRSDRDRPTIPESKRSKLTYQVTRYRNQEEEKKKRMRRREL